MNEDSTEGKMVIEPDQIDYEEIRKKLQADLDNLQKRLAELDESIRIPKATMEIEFTI